MPCIPPETEHHVVLDSANRRVSEKQNSIICSSIQYRKPEASVLLPISGSPYKSSAHQSSCMCCQASGCIRPVRNRTALVNFSPYLWGRTFILFQAKEARFLLCPFSKDLMAFIQFERVFLSFSPFRVGDLGICGCGPNPFPTCFRTSPSNFTKRGPKQRDAYPQPSSGQRVGVTHECSRHTKGNMMPSCCFGPRCRSK